MEALQMLKHNYDNGAGLNFTALMDPEVEVAYLEAITDA